jgi:hypothetical protein
MSQNSNFDTHEANRVKKKVEQERRGFRIHRTVYMFVIPMLAVINILLVPEFLWFFFPAAGWGFGLTMHYLFGVRRLEKSLVGSK